PFYRRGHRLSLQGPAEVLSWHGVQPRPAGTHSFPRHEFVPRHSGVVRHDQDLDRAGKTDLSHVAVRLTGLEICAQSGFEVLASQLVKIPGRKLKTGGQLAAQERARRIEQRSLDWRQQRRAEAGDDKPRLGFAL